MAIGYGKAVPKPPTQLEDRIAAKREQVKKEDAFRKQVWLRDKGLCRVCGVKVLRTITLDPRRGEVHHRRGRNVAPEDRFNVARAVLLCARCHLRVTRHEVVIPKGAKG